MGIRRRAGRRLAVAPAADSPPPAVSAGTLKVMFGTTDVVDNLNPFLGYTSPSYEIYHHDGHGAGAGRAGKVRAV